jgi:DNA-directed RNA polymerase specialized sigma24 family protein
MDADEGSITRWIGHIRVGDRAAAQPLWEAYFRRLVALARAQLHATSRRVADAEDVALSAFDSFYRRAEGGQFARLTDRDDLWQILVLITERKAIDLMRREGRKSRGEGRVVPFSEAEGRGHDVVADPGPTPEFAAQVVDEFRELLRRLGDDSLRNVALAKMEGYTNRQIAERLGCIEQTVERKLRSIRKIWSSGRET